MSFARRSPAFQRADFRRHFMRRLPIATHDLIGLLMRTPRLLVMFALAAIVVGALAYLFFKARDGTTPAGTIDKSASSKAAPATETVNANVGPDLMSNWTRLEPAYKSYKILVGNDNSLQTDQQSVELYGVTILPRSQICTYRSGERWACGQRAYVALLNIFGAATVDCKPQQINQPRTVVCRLGGSDIAELMLREGWGNLANGITDQYYANAAAAAVNRKTGMWSIQPSKR